jgi:hypothetical protein
MESNDRDMKQSERALAENAGARPLQIERPTRIQLLKDATKEQLKFLRTMGGREYYLYRPDRKHKGYIVWRVPDIRDAFRAGARYKTLKAHFSQIGHIVGELSRDPSCSRSIQGSYRHILKRSMDKIHLALHGGRPDGDELYGTYFMLNMHHEIVMLAREDQAEAVGKIMKNCMLEAYGEVITTVTHGPVDVTISASQSPAHDLRVRSRGAAK